MIEIKEVVGLYHWDFNMILRNIDIAIILIIAEKLKLP